MDNQILDHDTYHFNVACDCLWVKHQGSGIWYPQSLCEDHIYDRAKLR
jgi:hypothetical protein